MHSHMDPPGTTAPQTGAGAPQKGILSTFRAARAQALGELLALLQRHHAGHVAQAQAQRARERAVRPGGLGTTPRSSGIGVSMNRPRDDRVTPAAHSPHEGVEPPVHPRRLPETQPVDPRLPEAQPVDPRLPEAQPMDPRVLDTPALKDTQVFAVPPVPAGGAAEHGGKGAVPADAEEEDGAIWEDPLPRPRADRAPVSPGAGAFLRPSPAPPLTPRIRPAPEPPPILREPRGAPARSLAPKLDVTELDQYQVLNEIGNDGAEACYRALHRESGRVGVLVTRRMTRDMAGKATVRMAAWALETSGISHHAIPRVTGWGSVEGTVYFVVSTNATATLEQVLQQREPLSYLQVLRILQSVADALDHIHERGTSHGDLRPNSILVRDDGLGADLLGSGLDAVLRAEIPDAPWDSSAAYLAPECWARRKPADARADQFALAVIAFELITGRRRSSHTEYTGMVAVDPVVVPPLTPLRPEAPVNVNAALTRALSARPTVRFATCGEFITALIGDSLAEKKEERRFRLWR